MSPLRFLSVVRARRAALARRFDVVRQFEAIEESCVPSYVHANPAAALVAWSRLGAAAALYRRHAPAGPVLDFGAATGELRHILAAGDQGAPDYHFIEQDETLAAALAAELPTATRETDVAPGRYAAIFALDSLEHNDDPAALLAVLAAGLRPDGVLILSGPTESWLYRLGRRIAGFSGHYHKTTIHDIERSAGRVLARRAGLALPLPGLTLFRLGVWTRR